jgi:hypothetical protein
MIALLSHRKTFEMRMDTNLATVDDDIAIIPFKKILRKKNKPGRMDFYCLHLKN